jgi:2-isopropylmalate synthase
MDSVVRVFDTTLRDGEQAPGGSMTAAQKVELARRLDRLGVDVIEAGFPAASPGDLESVEMVAQVVDRAEVAALARCVRRDIDAAAKALVPAKNPVLHVFVATSDIHLQHKLRCTREEVIAQVTELVSYARSFCPRVEFSAEDATRTDWDFLVSVCEVAARAGATTINLPDTVGYSFPDEHAEMFRYMREHVDGADDIVFSAHCHDDLGLATANTLAAIAGGARQVELTMNGLGERAGNAPLEEVVMALKTRGKALGLPDTRIDSRQLVPTSQLVSKITGLQVQVNKSVVGANAFAHEAGIHQDGFIKERTTYEIMLPEDVGWEESRLVLGKHSGRHGVDYRLKQLGYDLDKEALDGVYVRVIELADSGKRVDDEALRTLVHSRNGKSHRFATVTPAPTPAGHVESS